MNNINNNNVFNRQELSSSALKAPSPSEFDHISYLAGIRIISPDLDSENESGYKVHRLATELIPAYFSILGPKNISQFWCVLFYFTLIMLGIGQSLALFHTVIQGIIAIKASFFKPLEGSVTFVVCSFGFLAAIPAGCEVSGIHLPDEMFLKFSSFNTAQDSSCFYHPTIITLISIYKSQN